MTQSKYVLLLECDVIKESDKAFLIDVPDGNDFSRKWVPKSQIEDSDGLEVGDVGIAVSVTRWFAEQENLEWEEG